MIALSYLLAAAAYFALMFFVVRAAWRYGSKHSKQRAWAFAIVGFLVVYLPVFWDHIPTVLAHRYYCAKDGGLTVFKDPQQWLAEHQDELESLRVKSGGEPVNQMLPDGWERSALINRDVAVETQQRNMTILPGVEIWRNAKRLFDVQSGNVLATHVNYGSYYGLSHGGVRFWLWNRGCDETSRQEFGGIWASYKIYFD